MINIYIDHSRTDSVIRRKEWNIHFSFDGIVWSTLGCFASRLTSLGVFCLMNLISFSNPWIFVARSERVFKLCIIMKLDSIYK